MAVVALYAVFAKELRETLRDPNAFALSVLYPLLVYPALVWGFSAWTEYQDGQSAGQDAAIAVLGPAANEISEAMAKTEGVHVLSPEATGEAAATEALARGEIAAIVEVNPNDGAGLDIVTQWRSDLPASGRARKAVGDALDALRTERIGAAAQAAGLPADAATWSVKMDDVAVRRSLVPWALSVTLPVVLVLNAMIVGFYPAIEVAVGERERRTLETTLVTAAPRSALIGGKLLVVLFIVTVATFVNLGAILLSGWQLLQILKFDNVLELNLPAGTWLGVLGCTLLAAVVLEGWVLLAVLRARDFKQAQNIATFVLVGGTGLALLGALEGFGTDLGGGLVPVTNLVAVMREWIAGRPVWPALGIALVENVVLGLVPVALAARVVGSETWRLGARRESR